MYNRHFFASLNARLVNYFKKIFMRKKKKKTNFYRKSFQKINE